MAFWVVGGEARPLSQGEGSDNTLGPDLYGVGGKRSVGHLDEHDFCDHDDHDDHDDEFSLPKRPRLSYVAADTDPGCPPRGSVPVQNLSFLVIREQTSPTPQAPECIEPDVSPSAMERTASGLSISSDTSIYNLADQKDSTLLDDDAAARLVEHRLLLSRRRAKDTQHERILRTLIQPRFRHAEFSIDNAALESIFSAANEIFFHNCLSRRVTWDWSHASSSQYKDHIIGTTALRRSKMGGFETLIVLSNPILKDKKYNRRLLISTFLHELIHSYLFIKCGIKARHCGGHTAGFRRIAELIDLWAGPDNLHLRDMQVDLDHFRQHPPRFTEDGSALADPLSRAIFPSAQEHLVPHHPAHYDHRPYDRSQLQSQDRWDYYIDDHRGYFPVSRGVSPTLTIPTTTEGDFEETAILEEVEIREPRGRLFFPASSRYSSAHNGRHYDSQEGSWTCTDDRRSAANLSYGSNPSSIVTIR